MLNLYDLAPLYRLRLLLCGIVDFVGIRAFGCILLLGLLHLTHFLNALAWRALAGILGCSEVASREHHCVILPDCMSAQARVASSGAVRRERPVRHVRATSKLIKAIMLTPRHIRLSIAQVLVRRLCWNELLARGGAVGICSGTQRHRLVDRFLLRRNLSMG